MRSSQAGQLHARLLQVDTVTIDKVSGPVLLQSTAWMAEDKWLMLPCVFACQN